MHSDMQSQVVSCRRVQQEREVHQVHISQFFQNMEHSEARLRVQSQTEELMMVSMIENVEETSESEMQAVKSIQEIAQCQEERAKKLTTEVAECTAKRIATGNSLHHSPAPPTPSGMHCSQTFTPTERVAHHYLPLDAKTSRRMEDG